MELINIMVNSIKNISVSSIADIFVVTYIFYKIYMLIKETRAEQLLKGIILIIFLIPVSSFFNLTMLNWILTKTITIGVLSFIIIFQPEIRRALEQLGRSSFLDKHVFQDDERIEYIIGEITNAVDALSKTRTGALIIIEQLTGLEDIANSGIKLNADVSSALIENIFVVNTPLHDGAVIVRNDKIHSAACILPLTNNQNINKKLGTRHRAAIGISENSDALIIIVSEETGTISLAVNGNLTRNYDSEKLKDIIVRIIRKRNSRKSTIREQVKLWKEKVNRNS